MSVTQQLLLMLLLLLVMLASGAQPQETTTTATPPPPSPPPAGPVDVSKLTTSEPLSARVERPLGSCSVACGVGALEVASCLETQGTEPTQCRKVTRPCLRRADCGVRAVSVVSGHGAALDCLGPEMARVDLAGFSFAWRWAPGAVTEDPSEIRVPLAPAPPSSSLSWRSATERAAGSYRCVVTARGVPEPVKIVLFVLKVKTLQLPFADTSPDERAGMLQQLAQALAAFYRDRLRGHAWAAALLVLAGFGLPVAWLCLAARCGRRGQDDGTPVLP
uniref:Transmembrane protein 81 n=1 Tax=Petromyzon marinus TaxID=7757 RepID=A0AAJ7SL38_PETMA|nr:uncharacterized protein LOC116938033 [Petromyzon marinus]